MSVLDGRHGYAGASRGCLGGVGGHLGASHINR
jgi:hypothetical protein